MVNTTGGKQHKKAKKHRVVPNQTADHQVILADENQVYAIVKKKIGGSRVWVECSDNKERSALIPGRFFKKLWFNPGDIILCSLEPTDDSSCQIEHKYTPKDASTLKAQGKMSFDVIHNEQQENKGFKFTDAPKSTAIVDDEPSQGSNSDSSDNFGIESNPNKQVKKPVKKSAKKKGQESSESNSA